MSSCDQLLETSKTNLKSIDIINLKNHVGNKEYVYGFTTKKETKYDT